MTDGFQWLEQERDRLKGALGCLEDGKVRLYSRTVDGEVDLTEEMKASMRQWIGELEVLMAKYTAPRLPE